MPNPAIPHPEQWLPDDTVCFRCSWPVHKGKEKTMEEIMKEILLNLAALATIMIIPTGLLYSLDREAARHQAITASCRHAETPDVSGMSVTRQRNAATTPPFHQVPMVGANREMPAMGVFSPSSK